ncbi:MAG: hypothetical protein ACE5D6_05135, partial [Candidatus Zixiibacteriota bacterium]
GKQNLDNQARRSGSSIRLCLIRTRQFLLNPIVAVRSRESNTVEKPDTLSFYRLKFKILHICAGVK